MPAEARKHGRTQQPETEQFPIRVSDEAFALICAENELLRFERSAEGVLETMAPSGGETSRELLGLAAQLWMWNRQTGLGVAFGPDAAFRLPNGAIRGPDAAWISLSRWETIPRTERLRFPPICPDFVLELLSPSDASSAARAKMREYQREGLRLGWLIDPRRRVVEITRAGSAAPEAVIAPATLAGEDVLPGLVLDLAGVFA